MSCVIIACLPYSRSTATKGRNVHVRSRSAAAWFHISTLTCLLSTGLLSTCLLPVARADERAASRRFEAAKADEPSLIAFCKAMPKGADLHVHVSGAAYAEYALDNAIAQKLFYDPGSGLFVTEDTRQTLPAQDLLKPANGDLLGKFLDAASMRGLKPDSESGHDHFFAAFGFIDSAQTNRPDIDVNGEVIARALAQNEQYLELMTRVAPDAAYNLLKSPPPVNNVNAPADLQAALTSLKPRLQEFIAQSKRFLDNYDTQLAARVQKTRAATATNNPEPISGAQSPITVRYIVSTSRLKPDSDFFAVMAAGMALMQEDKRVVGVNIVAPEDHPFARLHFHAQMQMLDFLWQQLGHPNITLHAGELTPTISPLEAMQSRIRDSIQIGHARRIGHGISIAWEDGVGELLRNMRRQGVAVEICLTSNAGILGVEGNRHPFMLYRKAGVPVTLNTDDEAINRSSLTMEFVRAARTYNLSYADVKTLARNSIAYSFLKGDSLFMDAEYHSLRPEFAGITRPDWKPSPEARKLLDGSEKMQVQARLEQAFALFENAPEEDIR